MGTSIIRIRKVKKKTPLNPPPPAIKSVSTKLNLKIKTAEGMPAKPGFRAQEIKTAKAAERDIERITLFLQKLNLQHLPIREQYKHVQLIPHQ